MQFDGPIRVAAQLTSAWLPPGPAMLFCPADRPDRYKKAMERADVVILDLEDGCAAKDRPAARQALIDTPLDPARTVVRLNPSDTADHPLDLAALAKTPYTTVMLAKTESAEQVRALAPLDVVVLVETPLGALAVTGGAAGASASAGAPVTEPDASTVPPASSSRSSATRAAAVSRRRRRPGGCRGHGSSRRWCARAFDDVQRRGGRSGGPAHWRSRGRGSPRCRESRCGSRRAARHA